MGKVKPLSEKELSTLKELDNLRAVHSILSKEDALTVFVKVAEEGVRSDLDAPNRLGLTKKRYYTKLRILVELGLVEKVKDLYILTSLGENVCKSQVINLAATLRDSKKHQMVDVLRKDPRFSVEEIEKAIDIKN